MGLTFRMYKEGDEEGIVGLLRNVFETYNKWGITREDWLLYDRIDYGFDRNMAFVAEDDGRIVGHVQVVFRDIKMDEDTYVRNGGIANVSTLPEYRGRGIATRLLKEALGYFENAGVVISSLFTGYRGNAHRIYRRLGYSDTYFKSTFFGKREEAGGLAERLRNGGDVELGEISREVLGDLAKVYNEWSKGWIGACRRPLSYWANKVLERSFYHTFFFDHDEAFIKLYARKDGYIVGYVIAAVGGRMRKGGLPEEEGSILELVGIDKPSMSALLRGALERLLDEGVKNISVHAPPEPPYNELLRGFKVFGGEGVYMDRIVDFGGLLKRLENELSRRLEEGGFSADARVLLRTPYGDSLLVVEGDRVSVEGGGAADNMVELDRDSTCRLVYGLASFRGLISEGRIRSIKLEDGNLIEVLQTLFPRKKFHIWLIDHW